MQSVEEFLAYSIKLEQEAATRYDELADAMEFLRQSRGRQALSNPGRLLEEALGRLSRAFGISRRSRDGAE